MKYLSISSGKGFFWNGEDYLEIDRIDKSDLLYLLNAAEKDEFEYDRYDQNKLHNKAHQIIYENLHNKLEQFLEDRSQFKREVEGLYKDAIRKYSAEIEDEDIEAIEDFEEDKEDEETPNDEPV